MPEKIAAFCRETGQPVPGSDGEYVRTILESLALTYAQTLEQLERVIGKKIETLHIVGGGSRSDLLNQLTADATGRTTVIAGPVEATAIGNILIQATRRSAISNQLAICGKSLKPLFPRELLNPEPVFQKKSGPVFKNYHP